MTAGAGTSGLHWTCAAALRRWAATPPGAEAPRCICPTPLSPGCTDAVDGRLGAALNLLVVARRPPWMTAHGGHLRLHGFLRQLARAANVTLVTADAGAGAANAGGTRPGRALRAHFGHNPALWHWLREHARPHHFDVALLSGAATGVYADAPAVPFVWDLVDDLVLATVRAAGVAGPRTWPRALRHALLQAAYERWVSAYARATIATSRLDLGYLRRWTAGAQLHAISNGVDLEYFRPTGRPTARRSVLFFGNLSFAPNVDAVRWFAREIWPAVHSAHPSCGLTIVGRDPAPDILPLRDIPGVRLHADVPDLRPWLRDAAVVIAPLRSGGGVKNKILEACAAARPVLASPAALGDLRARPGTEIVVAGAPRAWQAKLNVLLANPAAAESIGRAGRRWVERDHAWRRSGVALLDVLTRAAGRLPVLPDSSLSRTAPRAAPVRTQGETPAELQGAACR